MKLVRDHVVSIITDVKNLQYGMRRLEEDIAMIDDDGEFVWVLANMGVTLTNVQHKLEELA